MTLDDFKAARPRDLSGLLLALWYDHQGQWERAHTVAQDIETPDAAWVHAYLHRREGDSFNASYWYRRANRPSSAAPLAEEWETIAEYLLQQP